jgi:hypothetical protein
MDGPNKLECFSLARIYQPSQLFASKARAYEWSTFHVVYSKVVSLLYLQT